MIWALTKGHRRAHAAVRRLSQGLELRAYVNGGLLISHLHKRGAVDALQAQSAQHLDDFKNLNWLPVRS